MKARQLKLNPDAGLRSLVMLVRTKKNTSFERLVLAHRNKVVLENEVVRVLEAIVPLHSWEPPHTHFWPRVFFEQTSGRDEPGRR